MAITAQYDPEADALYVRIREGVRARTIELDETTYVDVDAEGHALGLELLYPSLGIDIEPAADRFQLHQLMPEIISAIAKAGLPTTAAAPTMTGATHLASMSIVNVVVEGTVAAGQLEPAPGITQPDVVISG